MTNIERQILVNQVVIMSSLMHFLNSKYGNEQDIKDLGKCVVMTHNLINPQNEATDVRDAILNSR